MTLQIQMRFCLQETSCEQEDCFPPSIAVKVNGKLCPLPVSAATKVFGLKLKNSRAFVIKFLKNIH